MSNKKAIVLGATGLVGSALVEQLVAADYHTIITLTRRPLVHSSAKVVNHVIDFEQLDSYQNLLHGDVLFSCLGTTKKIAGTIEKQRIVDVEYQFKAAQHAVNNRVEHYVLVSSSGANINSHNTYLQMKGELEQRVLDLPFVRVSILQPSLLLGERASGVRLGETLASYFLPVFCTLPGLKKYRPISAEQVAKKMLNIATRSGLAQEYFTLDELFY